MSYPFVAVREPDALTTRSKRPRRWHTTVHVCAWTPSYWSLSLFSHASFLRCVRRPPIRCSRFVLN